MSTKADIEAMIARVALGDRAAFAALYDATSAKLFGVALRVLNSAAEAEEVLQDAFIKIWQNADRYRANGLSPMTWLITLVRNTAIDRVRRRRDGAADLAEAEALPDAAPGPEAQAIASSERARIAACLDTLEPEKAVAVRRAYLAGHTYQQLADDMGVPINSIRTWLRRSLLKLKDCLSQ